MLEDVRFPRAERWAAAVVAAVRSDRDPRTLAAWGMSVAASRGALRAWCHAARVSPRSSLDFARVLRVVCRTPRTAEDPLCLLDFVDPRTMTRMLRRGGLASGDLRAMIRRPDRFLESQRFVSDPILIAAAREVLFGNVTRTWQGFDLRSGVPPPRARATTQQ